MRDSVCGSSYEEFTGNSGVVVVNGTSMQGTEKYPCVRESWSQWGMGAGTLQGPARTHGQAAGVDNDEAVLLQTSPLHLPAAL